MVGRYMFRVASVGIGGLACVTAYHLQKPKAACATEENYTFTASTQWDNDWDK